MLVGIPRVAARMVRTFSSRKAFGILTCLTDCCSCCPFFPFCPCNEGEDEGKLHDFRATRCKSRLHWYLRDGTVIHHPRGEADWVIFNRNWDPMVVGAAPPESRIHGLRPPISDWAEFRRVLRRMHLHDPSTQ